MFEKCVFLQDGQTLIRMGEQGARLFLIRRGQVRVMRPSERGEAPPTTLAVLGRGHFVGERTLVTGRVLCLRPEEFHLAVKLPVKEHP